MLPSNNPLPPSNKGPLSGVRTRRFPAAGPTPAPVTPKPGDSVFSMTADALAQGIMPHVQCNEEGSTEVYIKEPLRAISIGNIFDVVSHEVSDEAGAVLHLVRFRSGGLLRLLYKDGEELLELSGFGMEWTLTKDRVLVVNEH